MEPRGWYQGIWWTHSAALFGWREVVLEFQEKGFAALVSQRPDVGIGSSLENWRKQQASKSFHSHGWEESLKHWRGRERMIYEKTLRSRTCRTDLSTNSGAWESNLQICKRHWCQRTQCLNWMEGKWGSTGYVYQGKLSQSHWGVQASSLREPLFMWAFPHGTGFMHLQILEYRSHGPEKLGLDHFSCREIGQKA